MDKKRLAFASNSIVALVMLGMAVFYFFSPENRNPNTIAYSQVPVSPVTNGVEYGSRYAPEKDLIGGICALLLVGYLFWTCYRKFQTDSQTEQAAQENTLYNISLETGRNEYELFIKFQAIYGRSGYAALCNGLCQKKPSPYRRIARKKKRRNTRFQIGLGDRIACFSRQYLVHVFDRGFFGLKIHMFNKPANPKGYHCSAKHNTTAGFMILLRIR
jgi:hypothetical protein